MVFFQSRGRRFSAHPGLFETVGILSLKILSFSLLFFSSQIFAQTPDPNAENPSPPIAFGHEFIFPALSPTPANGRMGQGDILKPEATYSSLIQYLEQQEHFESEDAVRMAGEILQLFQEMREKGRSLERQTTEDRFEGEIERGNVRHAIENVGRAKVTFMDGFKWIKVVHRQSQTAFVFLNRDKIHPDSEHSHLVISNIHFNSGKHILPEELPELWQQQRRRRGALFGRNVARLMYHERDGAPEDLPVVEDVSTFSRPNKELEPERYAYEYRLACDKPFSLPGFLVNGGFIGLLQVGVLVGLNEITPYIPLIGGERVDLNPALLKITFLYSFYAGGWLMPKLRAMSQRFTFSERFWLRGLTVSLPYALIYKSFVTHNEFVDALRVGLFPLAAYFLHQGTEITINFFINNRVSSQLSEHTQLDQELRPPGARGNIRWLERLFGLKVKLIDFKLQIRYVAISFSSRTLDLNNKFKGVVIHLPGYDWAISAGKLLYIILPDIIRYTVMRRAERAGSPSARAYREGWRHSLTARVSRAVVHASGLSVRATGSICKFSLARLRGLRDAWPSARQGRELDDFGQFLH